MTEVSRVDRNGSPEADDVAAVVAEYESAFNRNDARAMNRLFAEDAIFVNFAGTLVFGAEPLYRAQAAVFDRGGALEHVQVRYLIESLVFLTPEVAVVHARQRSAGPDGGDPGDPMAGILQLTLLRGTGGRWRIRVGQNTPVAARTGR
ncbi:uncharacterized protein (TIGR02246 family) [Prauserella shujinwangii]|uniref:Uncharacterized protein (TIGR02246 family) n=1 Tax=Prauserella shujinwangii TaxID=1453103 RepID=A0A2T0M411_9PSEU|nr:SgcJ/EcaC family oxidoreductase [Prauserella shujinwangii]PRX51491.1 uncharacterized protein (TIGR02246 family) [Prauserella shujinwangii]